MLAKRTVENPKNRQATRSNIDNIESGKIVITNNRKITISECGLMQVGRKEVASAFEVVNDLQRQPEVRSLDFRFEVSVQGVGRFRFFTAIQANMSDMFGYIPAVNQHVVQVYGREAAHFWVRCNCPNRLWRLCRR
jgi:hypothetical protein